MPEGEQPSFVSRKEFYASMGLVWLFLAFLSLASFWSSIPDLYLPAVPRVGAIVLFVVAMGMSIFNSRVRRERSRPTNQDRGA